jgi:hypothetical protein
MRRSYQHQHSAEPVEQHWQLEEELVVKGDEELGTFDNFFGKSVLLEGRGLDEAVVVFVFGVSFEDDGPGSFAKREKAVERRVDGDLEFSILYREQNRTDR